MKNIAKNKEIDLDLIMHKFTTILVFFRYNDDIGWRDSISVGGDGVPNGF